MRKILALLLIVGLVFPAPARSAECQKPVTLLEEGASAPCRGFLFSPSKELEVRVLKQDYSLISEELDYFKKIIEKYKSKDLESDKIIQAEQQKSELWRVRAEDITLKYVSQESGRTTRDMVFFGLGVLTIVLSAYVVKQTVGNK